jgi:hypothetical protein
VQPLRIELRKALRIAHPELTERDLERFDALSSQLMALGPDDEKARAIREKLNELVSGKMPHFREVLLATGPRGASSRSSAKANVKIRWRR